MAKNQIDLIYFPYVITYIICPNIRERLRNYEGRINVSVSEKNDQHEIKIYYIWKCDWYDHQFIIEVS